MKVGADIQEDIRRATIVREEIGWDRKLMMDANQAWDVNVAIANMKLLARFDPWWIEEPTSPDDVLGHAEIARAIAPIGVATGEQGRKTESSSNNSSNLEPFGFARPTPADWVG